MKAVFTVCLSSAFVALFGGASSTVARAATEGRPNVLVLFTDDVNYGGFGFGGAKFGPTPNVDMLAADGVVFSNAYVTAPVCSPSRAGLVTGRYPSRFGHEFNGGQKTEKDGLPTTEKTIGDRMKALGYRTALFGKWHLGHGINFPAFHPQARGFDEFYGFMGSGIHFARSTALYAGTRQVDEPRYLTDVLGEQTAEYIHRNRDRAWFCYTAFNFIHTPLEATEADVASVASDAGRDERTVVKRAMTIALDRAVGRILEALRETGQEENTLIVLTNDNGDYGDNAQFRGGKGNVTEGGVRVPFVVRWKGRVKPGRNDRDIVSTLDILPTAMDAAGGKIDPAWGLDGASLLPLLLGVEGARGHDRLFFRTGEAKAMREGDWKITLEGSSGYGKRKTDDTWKLYNLRNDPAEQTNLAAGEPERFAAMQATYAAWESTLAAPLWTPGGSGEMGQHGAAPGIVSGMRKTAQE